MYRHLEQSLAQRMLDCLQRCAIPASRCPRSSSNSRRKSNSAISRSRFFPLPSRCAPRRCKIAEAIRRRTSALIEGIAGMQVTPPAISERQCIDRAWMRRRLNRSTDQKPAVARFLPARFWSNIPASIPTRRRILDTCAMPFLAILSSACCWRGPPRRHSELHRQHRRASRRRRRRLHPSSRKIARRNRSSLPALPRFDYYCWDLYASVAQWYEADPQNRQVRLQTAARYRSTHLQA